MEISGQIEDVSKIIDVFGVAVIVVGLAIGTAVFAKAMTGSADRIDAFRSYRRFIGRAILLGLEALVAADIIRTVAVTPTFAGVGVLAIIVLIRTFLSFTLELEIDGRWPWQKKAAAQPAGHDG